MRQQADHINQSDHITAQPLVMSRYLRVVPFSPEGGQRGSHAFALQEVLDHHQAEVFHYLLGIQHVRYGMHRIVRIIHLPGDVDADANDDDVDDDDDETVRKFSSSSALYVLYLFASLRTVK